jgi:hypothetical protein
VRAVSAAVAAVFLVGFLCAIIGGAVGAPRGHGGVGFLLGLLFGPLGILIVVVMAPAETTVPTALGAVPAGWYPDPLGTHVHRYWDGV